MTGPRAHVTVTDMASGAQLPHDEAAKLARFIEYTLTGWLIRTGRSGYWG